MPETVVNEQPQEVEQDKGGVMSKVTEEVSRWRMKFRSFIAVLLLAWACALLWKACFAQPDTLSETAKYIVGFVTGSVVGAIIGFYFVSTEKQEVATNETQ